jgi:hypothetical protein
MKKPHTDPFVIDWPTVETCPEVAVTQPLLDLETAPLPTTGETVGFWGYDRINQDEAEHAALGLGISLEICERPEELAGSALVILDLDALHPWGNSACVFEAAAATAGGSTIVGVSYNDEHPLKSRIPLFHSVLEVFIAVAARQLP